MYIAKQLKIKQFHLSVVMNDRVVSWAWDALVLCAEGRAGKSYREHIKEPSPVTRQCAWLPNSAYWRECLGSFPKGCSIKNPFSSQSSYDGHLDCFHVLAILNIAAMNIGMHVSFWIRVFSGYMPKSPPKWFCWPARAMNYWSTYYYICLFIL